MPSISLGDVNFRLGADTSSLTRSVTALRNFSKTVDAATASTSGNARALLNQEKMSADALRTVLKFNAALRATDANSPAIAAATNAWKKYNNALISGQRSTADLQRATMQFKNTLSALQNNQGQSKGMVEGLARQERAIQSANRAAIQLQATLNKTEGGKTLIPDVQASFAKYSAAVKAAGADTLAFQRAGSLFKDEMQGIRLKVAEGSKTLTGFAGVLRRASQEAVLIYGPLGGIATRLLTLANIADTAGAKIAVFFGAAAITSVGLAKMTGYIIDSGREFQKYQIALAGITGSQQVANATLNDAKNIANKTGNAYSAIIPEYVKFTAAVKGTALQGQKAHDVFLSIAKVTGTLQMSAEETSGVFKALEQMVSKGVVQSEELRGQMGDRLPGAFQIAARAMGISTAALSDMMKKGQLVATDFLPKFAAEVEKTFGTSNLAMINNYTASQMRMFNSFTDFFVRINELTNVTGKMQTIFNALASTMEFLTSHLEDIGKMAAIAAAAFTTMFASQMYSGLAFLTQGIITLTRALFAMDVALAIPSLASFINLAAMAATALFLYHDQITQVTGSLNLFLAIVAAVAIAFGGALVASFAAATYGAFALGGALVFLRAALIRTGFGAVVVLLGEIVYWFLEIIDAVGGFGEAMSAIWEITKEVGQQIVWIFVGIGVSIHAQWVKIKASIVDILIAVITYIGNTFVNKVIGAFVGVYEAVKAAWDALPAALANVGRLAINALLGAMQVGINKVTDAINFITTLGGKVPGNAIVAPDLLQYQDNTVSAAANVGAKARAAFDAAFKADYASGMLVDLKDTVTDLNNEAMFLQSMADAYLAKGFSVPPSLTALIAKIKALSTAASNVPPAIAPIAPALGNLGTTGSDNVQKLVDKFKSLRDVIEDSLVNAMMDIVSKKSTVIGAFRELAAAIIKELYKVLVVQRLVGAFGGLGNKGGFGILGWLSGLIPGLQTPTVGTAAGGQRTAGQTVIVGEQGPEEMTLGSNAYFRSNRNSGIGSSVTIVQNINISTGVVQTVRGEILNLLPKIAEASKAAVLDAAQRGGKFGKVVG